MRNAFEISQAVKLGNLFHRDVMEWDRRKHSVPRNDLVATLTSQAATLATQYLDGFRTSIEFGDVHAKMRRHWHTELAYVTLRGLDCRLLFAEKLLTSVDPNAGLNFPAKTWVLLLVLAQALAVEPALQGEFVFEIGDNASYGEVGFNSSHPDACLIIDPDFASSDGYLAYRNTSATQMVAWERREAKIFWRGSTTGRRVYTPPAYGEADDLKWLDRLALCVECAKPGLKRICDFAVTQVSQIPEPHLQARIHASGLLKPGVPRQQFMNYRGVFDIDGNASAWSGLFSSMLGASCIFKIASREGYRQWYSGHLEPWENYVPVKTDLSDLHEAVHWFGANEEQAKLMAARAREIAVSIDTKSALVDSARNIIQLFQRRRH